MLKKLLNVTVSATIEARPELPQNWIQQALSECVGGRSSNRKLRDQRDGLFLVDKTTFRSAPRKALGFLGQRIGTDLTTGARFWQKWADLLLRWSCADQKSKIENRK
jgi:hypothetical protein